MHASLSRQGQCKNKSSATLALFDRVLSKHDRQKDEHKVWSEDESPAQTSNQRLLTRDYQRVQQSNLFGYQKGLGLLEEHQITDATSHS